MQKVCIWTPDKDLGQCVQGDRVVQVDRKSGKILDAAGVREKFGVDPEHIPDFLALVGDAADGYPGLAGIGKVGAVRLIRQFGRLEDFPAEVLNGAGVDGLAAHVKKMLRLKGVDVIETGGAPRPRERTVVYDRIGEFARAEAVRAMLGCRDARTVTRVDPSRAVDVSVELGTDCAGLAAEAGPDSR